MVVERKCNKMDKKSYEYIYQRYIVDNISLVELCEDLGLKVHQVTHILGKLGIKKIGTTLILKESDKVKDKDWLQEQFRTKSAREISEELGVTDSKVEYWLKKHGIQQTYKYPINSKSIDSSNPIFCYFAGLVATDGYLDKNVPRVSITLKGEGDDRVLEALADYFGYGGEIYRHNGRFTLCMTSPELVEELEKMGIRRFSNKTKEVEVPSWFASDDCLRLYVRGCIDGDGNIKKKSGVVRLACDSPAFVIDLVNILNWKGIEAEVKKHRGKYPSFELKREPSRKLLHWVYRGYDSYRLDRKYSVAYEVWGDDIVRPTLLPKKESNTSYREKDWLQRRVDEGLSISQIADLCGCDDSVISRWIKRHGICYVGRTNTGALRRADGKGVEL